MSDEIKRTDEERLPEEESMCEAENPYQSERAVTKSTDKPDENAAENSEHIAPKPKTVDKNAPVNNGTVQPKFARTPAPAEPSAKKTKGNQNTVIPADEQKENKQKPQATVIISRIVLVVSVLVFLVSGVIFAKNYLELRKNKLEAQKLASQLGNKAEEVEDAVGVDGILEKYRDLYNQNHDLVGWITVPNTKIDHPVVQAADNDFYLRKNFSKKYERRGSIFMDFRCDPVNFLKNTILYGHNYLDSTMFSDLEKYKDLDFYKSAPVIEFNTIYKNYKWKVFGVYLSNADEKDDNGYALYYIHPFMTDDNFEAYVQTVRERSIINMPVDVERTDKILTLSTCTRDMDLPGRGQTNARCVIVARLVRDGEREDVNVSAATYNENPRYPQVWYTAHGLENPYVNASRWYPEGNG